MAPRLDSHELAGLLEVTHGIQVRSGLMCCPRVHQALHAPRGSLRVSFGPFNTREEIDKLLNGLHARPDKTPSCLETGLPTLRRKEIRG